ncbi:signal peptidase I [Parabacteroides sp. OttesenSCG-928-G06]|nr:signal peptidase I [Parabacteroides sp. OttesenSCG-928-K15]MDL2282545.1 signal peptidase I [Parabacteroides sp. OttesenSCG-928-G06]
MGTTWKWIIALAIAFAVILALRQWVVASYSISTDSMEQTLQEGDFVLVDKLLSTPKRNDILLFSSPLYRDSLMQPLFISRCIGMPGDTVEVGVDGFLINGSPFPYTPLSMHTWIVDDRLKSACLDALQRLHILLRSWTQQETGYTLRLTAFEAWQVREEMGEERGLLLYEQPVAHRLIVPRKGQAYRLDEQSLLFCREAILAETDGKALFRDGKLFLDGRETSFFFFANDYYWMLSDNPREAIDSRHLGFIPEKCLTGKVWWRWYSKTRSRIFQPVY